MELANIIAITVLITLMLEMAWAYYKKRPVFYWKDSLANLSILSISAILVKPIAALWFYQLMVWSTSYQWMPTPSNWVVFLITFLLTDLIYYWFHRLSHTYHLLWSLHHTHHSSHYLNVTTAVRLNWLVRFILPFFFVPLVLLGFPAVFIMVSLAISLFYQFFLHTQAIPALGWLEGKLLNTPSAHRVHHASNALYRNKNFAGMLIIWDRLFDTYQAESEAVRYGIGQEAPIYNPLKIQFGALFQYWKRLLMT